MISTESNPPIMLATLIEQLNIICNVNASSSSNASNSKTKKIYVCNNIFCESYCNLKHVTNVILKLNSHSDLKKTIKLIFCGKT